MKGSSITSSQKHHGPKKARHSSLLRIPLPTSVKRAATRPIQTHDHHRENTTHVATRRARHSTPRRRKTPPFAAPAIGDPRHPRREPWPGTAAGFPGGTPCPAEARTQVDPAARGEAGPGRSRPGGWWLPQRPSASPTGCRRAPSAADNRESPQEVERGTTDDFLPFSFQERLPLFHGQKYRSVTGQPLRTERAEKVCLLLAGTEVCRARRLVSNGSTSGLMKGVLQGGVGGGEGHSFASLSPLMP